MFWHEGESSFLITMFRQELFNGLNVLLNLKLHLAQ